MVAMASLDPAHRAADWGYNPVIYDLLSVSVKDPPVVILDAGQQEAEMRRLFQDPDCHFIVYETLPWADETPDGPRVRELEQEVRRLQAELAALRTAPPPRREPPSPPCRLQPDSTAQLREELQALRRELDTQRSQFSQQLIKHRQEYDSKLSEVALAQARLKRREEELAQADDTAAVVAELREDLEAEQAQCQQLRRELAVLKAAAETQGDRDRELQRLRTIMRFSQLKRDSDELHDMRDRIHELEEQLRRQREMHRGDERELDRLRAVEHAFEELLQRPATAAAAPAPVPPPAPSKVPPDTERPHLPLRVRSLAADAALFEAVPAPAGFLPLALAQPGTGAQLGRRIRSASTQASRRPPPPALLRPTSGAPNPYGRSRLVSLGRA